MIASCTTAGNNQESALPAPEASADALAVERGANVVSLDRDFDFGRFPGLAWRHPGDDVPATS